MTQRQHLIPTFDGGGRGLVNHDEASKNFRAVEDTSKFRTHTWGRWLWAFDQGQTPECVANTGKGLVNTRNMMRNFSADKRKGFDRHEWYLGAQDNDQWAGHAYNGTSGLGLCRYLKSIGVINEYRWNFGLDEVRACLSWVGPTGIGVGWRDTMWDTDSEGFLNISGQEVGGHEVELLGNNEKLKYCWGINSWGVNWGVRGGRFKIRHDDLGALLENEGDSFVITA